MYLFLAASETWHSLMEEEEVPFRLYTYYHLRKKKNHKAIVGDLIRFKQKNPKARFFIDSGAFSLIVDIEKGRRAVTPNEYAKDYIGFLREHAHIFDIVAELDIDGAHPEATVEKVAAWREEIRTIVGHKTLYTWHPHRGVAEWQAILRDPKYKWVALANDTPNTLGLGAAMKMINQAKHAGKYVHGFGQTRIKTDMKFTKWTSCDSSSWVSGDRYGVSFIYRNGKMTVLNAGKDRAARAQERKKYSRYFENIGCDPAKIIKDDPPEVRKSSLIAWKMMSERLYEMGKAKGEHLVFESTSTPVEGEYESYDDALEQGRGHLDTTTYEVQQPKVKRRVTFRIQKGPLGQKIVQKVGNREVPAGKTASMSPIQYALTQSPEAICGDRGTSKIFPELLVGEEPVLPQLEGQQFTQHAQQRPTARKAGGSYAEALLEHFAPKKLALGVEEQLHEDHPALQELKEELNRIKDEVINLPPGTYNEALHKRAQELQAHIKHLSSSSIHLESAAQPPAAEKSRANTREASSEVEDKDIGGERDKQPATETTEPSSALPVPQMVVNGQKSNPLHLPVLHGKPDSAMIPAPSALFLKQRRREEAISEVIDGLPPLACSTCAISGDCPEFSEGQICAFLPSFQGLSTREVDNIAPLMHKIVDLDLQRTLFAVLSERLTAGGQVDPRVSAQLNGTLAKLQQLHALKKASDPRSMSLRVEQSGGRVSVSAEGPAQEGTQGPGILSRLFGATQQVDEIELNAPTPGVTHEGSTVVETQGEVVRTEPTPR